MLCTPAFEDQLLEHKLLESARDKRNTMCGMFPIFLALPLGQMLLGEATFWEFFVKLCWVTCCVLAPLFPALLTMSITDPVRAHRNFQRGICGIMGIGVGFHMSLFRVPSVCTGSTAAELVQAEVRQAVWSAGRAGPHSVQPEVGLEEAVRLEVLRELRHS